VAVKDKLVVVVKNPLVRKAVVGLVMAILAALGVSLGAGCTSAQRERVRDAFVERVSACVAESVHELPELLEPESEPADAGAE
jgi:hypothetical protein